MAIFFKYREIKSSNGIEKAIQTSDWIWSVPTIFSRKLNLYSSTRILELSFVVWKRRYLLSFVQDSFTKDPVGRNRTGTLTCGLLKMIMENYLCAHFHSSICKCDQCFSRLDIKQVCPLLLIGVLMTDRFSEDISSKMHTKQIYTE